MCDTPSLPVEEDLQLTTEEFPRMEMDLNSTEETSFEKDDMSADSPSDKTRSSIKSLLNNSVRSTRSKDNPDFMAKQRNFIAKVQAAVSPSTDNSYSLAHSDASWKRKRELSSQYISSGKRKKNSRADNFTQEWQNDSCCWECHREGQFICCEMCPRVFHLKCAGLEKEPEDDWACHECHSVMQAENVDNRSLAMQMISIDQLCILLKYALNRLQAMPAMQPFCKPVDLIEFPTYWDMVIHPVDFTTLEKNIKKKFYGSSEAFLSDARWIVHNSVIFNGANSKVTSLARTFLKILRQELSEIETCPDCYENAHKKPESWFTEACRLAHPLIWARLKGFPFWPAKAVKWKDSSVDVRFFGRHDRSWVQLKDCFLISEQMPTPLKNKNKTLEQCLLEVEEHINKLKEKFGTFLYAGHRVAFNPYDVEQIKLLLPAYKGPSILRMRSQARSYYSHMSDDETSSVTSTDSCTSSLRKHRVAMRDSLFLNTPDTEPDLGHLSNDDDKGSEGPEDKEISGTVDNDPVPCDTSANSSSLECNESELIAKALCVSNEQSVPDVNSRVLNKKYLHTGESADSKINAIDEVITLLNDDKLKLLKPGPLSRKLKLYNSSKLSQLPKSPSNSDVSMATSTLSIIDDLERINALLRNDVNGSSRALPNQEADAIENPSQFSNSNDGLNSDSTVDEAGADSERLDGSKVEEKVKEDSNDAENESKRENCKESPQEYFSGFIDEIGFHKKVNSHTELFEKCKIVTEAENDETTQDFSPAIESDAEKIPDTEQASEELPESPTPNENDDADTFNEQLLSNSSITVGKVIVKTGRNREASNEVDVSALNSFLPSVNIKVLSFNKSEDISNLKKASNPSDGKGQTAALDIKDYASKVFHNITISCKPIDDKRLSDATEGASTSMESKRRSSRERASKDAGTRNVTSSSDSLLEAVKLVQNIGNIAIKRLDSASDKMADSEANEKCAKAEGVDFIIDANDPLASLGSSVSVTKASERERCKPPSGVDTTRLSPSISIIPVVSSASTNEKPKSKHSHFPPPSSTPQSSFLTLPSASTTISMAVSPAMGSGGNITPSSLTASPSIPPPSLLSQALSSPTNINVRAMFSPHLPGLALPGAPRPSITSPGLRMMGSGPNLLFGGRLPGPQLIRQLPPDAGPLSCELHKHSQKLAEMMRASLEEVLTGLVGIGTPEARLAALQLELERCNWRHQQEIIEVRHNADVMLIEIRANLEAEKQRAVEEIRRQMDHKVTELRRQMEQQMAEKVSEVKRLAEIERQRVVEETKLKQWCANCGKEALFFCCWNTSYCDYPCQQAHWPQHMGVCGQNTDSGGVNNSEGGAESVNGDASSSHSSRVTTPIQSLLTTQIKHLMEEDDGVLDDRRRKKRKDQNPSPIFSEGMSAYPACSATSLVNSTIPMPIGGTSPLGSFGGGLRPSATSPVAAMASLSGATPGMGLKMPPRFMQHAMMQQQPMFGAMDPRMIMMMGRNLGPSLMMRGPMQHFRPRFM